MNQREIVVYICSLYVMVFLHGDRNYEIIKSRFKLHLKEGHFLSKHWGGVHKAALFPGFIAQDTSCSISSSPIE